MCCLSNGFADNLLFRCRLRLLKEEPHSQKLAEAAVGLGTDNGKRPEEDIAEMED